MYVPLKSFEYVELSIPLNGFTGVVVVDEVRVDPFNSIEWIPLAHTSIDYFDHLPFNSIEWIHFMD